MNKGFAARQASEFEGGDDCQRARRVRVAVVLRRPQGEGGRVGFDLIFEQSKLEVLPPEPAPDLRRPEGLIIQIENSMRGRYLFQGCGRNRVCDTRRSGRAAPLSESSRK